MSDARPMCYTHTLRKLHIESIITFSGFSTFFHKARTFAFSGECKRARENNDSTKLIRAEACRNLYANRNAEIELSSFLTAYKRKRKREAKVNNDRLIFV